MQLLASAALHSDLGSPRRPAGRVVGEWCDVLSARASRRRRGNGQARVAPVSHDLPARTVPWPVYHHPQSRYALSTGPKNICCSAQDRSHRALSSRYG